MWHSLWFQVRNVRLVGYNRRCSGEKNKYEPFIFDLNLVLNRCDYDLKVYHIILCFSCLVTWARCFQAFLVKQGTFALRLKAAIVSPISHQFRIKWSTLIQSYDDLISKQIKVLQADMVRPVQQPKERKRSYQWSGKYYANRLLMIITCTVINSSVSREPVSCCYLTQGALVAHLHIQISNIFTFKHKSNNKPNISFCRERFSQSYMQILACWK